MAASPGLVAMATGVLSLATSTRRTEAPGLPVTGAEPNPQAPASTAAAAPAARWCERRVITALWRSASRRRAGDRPGARSDGAADQEAPGVQVRPAGGGQPPRLLEATDRRL